MAKKQFKKWLNRDTNGQGCCLPNSICDKVDDCPTCESLQEEGWKAALEWVLSRVDSLNFKMFPTASKGYASVVCDIEKELNNE